MPLKNYLCTSLSAGGTHHTAVFDPVSHALILKTQWNPALLDTTRSTMESELQAIYGGDATVDYNQERFIGVSTAGEAVWALALSAADNASADFRNYMKVMAYSNTTARTIASSNQSVTKKPGENWAQPVSLVAYAAEKAYFAGYVPGATPNVRIYEASSAGVIGSPANTGTVVEPGVGCAALVYAGDTYLAPSALASSVQTGYLLRYISGTTWGWFAQLGGSSSTLYPLSQIEALVALDTPVEPTYVMAFGSSNEAAPLPQGKDPFGSFQINAATLTDLDTSTTFDMQPVFNAALGATATVDSTRQAFVYVNFPTPPFWQGKVLADEIV